MTYENIYEKTYVRKLKVKRAYEKTSMYERVLLLKGHMKRKYVWEVVMTRNYEWNEHMTRGVMTYDKGNKDERRYEKSYDKKV